MCWLLTVELGFRFSPSGLGSVSSRAVWVWAVQQTHRSPGCALLGGPTRAARQSSPQPVFEMKYHKQCASEISGRERSEETVSVNWGHSNLNGCPSWKGAERPSRVAPHVTARKRNSQEHQDLSESGEPPGCPSIAARGAPAPFASSRTRHGFNSLQNSCPCGEYTFKLCVWNRSNQQPIRFQFSGPLKPSFLQKLVLQVKIVQKHRTRCKIYHRMYSKYTSPAPALQTAGPLPNGSQWR